MNTKYVWTQEGIIKLKKLWETHTVVELAAEIGTTKEEVAKMVGILRANKIAMAKKTAVSESTKTVRSLIAQGLI